MSRSDHLKQTKLNNIVLIQDTASSMGGVETLVARIAKEFLERNIKVTVLILQESVSSNVIKIIPEGCQIIFFSKHLWNDWFFPRRFFNRHTVSLLPEHCDLMLAFSSASTVVMRLLRRSLYPNATEMVYVVHSSMLNHDCNENPSYIKGIVDSLNSSSVFFMNSACRSTHVNSGFMKFSDSKLIPLPVEPLVSESVLQTEKRKLVSIGRIQRTMKSYNWTFISDFSSIAVEYDLTWDIYGGGSLVDIESLQRAILVAGMSDRIFYQGEVEYKKMTEVLQSAFAFLGMGTAAVEAASMGIPTIIATAYSKDATSYGFLQDLPFPCIGEKLGGEYKERRIVDVFLDLLLADTERTIEICQSSRNRALEFSTAFFIDKIKEHINNTCPVQVLPFFNVIGLGGRYFANRIQNKLCRLFQ